MNKVLGFIYLIGSIVWIILMLPFTVLIGLYTLTGGIEEMLGGLGYWEYPVTMFWILLSLLLAFLTVKFGFSLVKSSWLKMVSDADSFPRFKSSFRKQR